MAVNSMGMPMTASRPITSFLPDHRGAGFKFPPVVDGASKHILCNDGLLYHKKYNITIYLIYWVYDS